MARVKRVRAKAARSCKRDGEGGVCNGKSEWSVVEEANGICCRHQYAIGLVELLSYIVCIAKCLCTHTSSKRQISKHHSPFFIHLDILSSFILILLCVSSLHLLSTLSPPPLALSLLSRTLLLTLFSSAPNLRALRILALAPNLLGLQPLRAPLLCTLYPRYLRPTPRECV